MARSEDHRSRGHDVVRLPLRGNRTHLAARRNLFT